MDTIDLAKILQAKNPRLARWTPKWVVRWLERVIRVPKINYLLTNFGHLEPLDFIRASLDYIKVSHTLHIKGEIDPNKRYIFVSNHPLGGLDGLVLSLAVSQMSPNGFKFVVNDLLMKVEPLAPIFVPVNKHGRQSASYAQSHKQMYEGPGQVISFPAGFCSRLIDGRVQDVPWRATFAQKALESEREVVPIFTSAMNSKKFYRFAKWRKKLGIKANLEMILLPRETFRPHQHLDIVIGDSITLDKSLTPKQWCEKIREQCYSLGEQFKKEQKLKNK